VEDMTRELDEMLGTRVPRGTLRVGVASKLCAAALAVVCGRGNAALACADASIASNKTNVRTVTNKCFFMFALLSLLEKRLRASDGNLRLGLVYHRFDDSAEI
jgi:hypothetical protein